MIQTKKEGVLHKGKIRKAGELLSLPAQDEERLVREGWATFVEAWASAPAEQAALLRSAGAEGPETGLPEDGLNTHDPEQPATSVEEAAPKKTRGRKK